MEEGFKIIPDEQTPAVDIIKQGIREFASENKEFIEEFLKFSSTIPTAIGLAANQVSFNGERVDKRMFAKKNRKTGEWSIVINPVIMKKKGMVRSKLEGCLTWANRYVIADRSYTVEVSYHDIDGEHHVDEFKGFEAQIWQHEINHLDGIPEEIVPRETTLGREKPINRNDACLCGSGKKYKKCCI